MAYVFGQFGIQNVKIISVINRQKQGSQYVKLAGLTLCHWAPSISPDTSLGSFAQHGSGFKLTQLVFWSSFFKFIKINRRLLIFNSQLSTNVIFLNRHQINCQPKALSHVSPHTGQICARLVGAPSVGAYHTGEHVANLVAQTLREHPAALREATHRRRLCAVGGDGAICRGGEHARHKSTDAANKFFSICQMSQEGMSEPVCLWDPYHRAFFCVQCVVFFEREFDK